MVGYKHTSDVAKKAAEIAEKIWLMVSFIHNAIVSFIHNGSKIATWMGHSFKTKSTKSKATFLK